MVDFHAHILPGADHGSNSIESSLKQAQLAVQAGVTTVIATPHFYMNKDNLETFYKRRDKCYNELVSALNDNNMPLKIIKGCEVNLQIDLFENKDLSGLCIEGTKYMLLELPLYISLTKWHFDAIIELRNMGIEPIIAHINRYDDYSLSQVFEREVFCQINVEAFKHFKSRLRVLKWIKDGRANFVGSDMHGFCEAYNDFYKYSKKYKKQFDIMDRNANNLLLGALR